MAFEWCAIMFISEALRTSDAKPEYKTGTAYKVWILRLAAGFTLFDLDKPAHPTLAKAFL